MVDSVQNLESISIFGFEGTLQNCFHCHPDDTHVIYPFGNSVVIQNYLTKQHYFLTEHSNLVTAVALSPNGKYVASGHSTCMGFKAILIIWDFETKTLKYKHEIHKVRIESIAFSKDSNFVISLGGRDDGAIVVYDCIDGKPLCGAPGNGSNSGNALVVCNTNLRNGAFVSAGDKTFRFWRIDLTNKKIYFTEIDFNKAKRTINCVAVSSSDEIIWCGTTTGDIAKFFVEFSDDVTELEPKRTKLLGCFAKYIGRRKMPNGCSAMCWCSGVTSILLLDKPGTMIVGAGDGLVEVVYERKKVPQSQIKEGRIKEPTIGLFQTDPKLTHHLNSAVTTIRRWGNMIFLGTALGELFTINMENFELSLRMTSHTSQIVDVCFPNQFSKVFATCSKDTIRVWNVESAQELLRITVPNFTCSGITFQYDGKGIVSSWNDGTIRSFTPVTGKMMYIIHNAHNKGVSALSITRDGKTIVSGGGEGQVRVWDIQPHTQKLRAVLQEHKGPVSAVSINNADTEAATASTDGSCIIWDLMRCKRKNIIFGSTLFIDVKYHPSDTQILTVGTDSKVTYWEAYDVSLIRDIEGSAVAALDCSPCGKYFATGGHDRIVKVWKYEEGVFTHTGLGHSGSITAIRFSSDAKYIASVSADGGIFIWKNPYSPWEPQIKTEAQEVMSVRSEPVKVEKLRNEECITRTMTMRCKCGRPNCKCTAEQKMRGCCRQCNKINCQCKGIIVRPGHQRSRSCSTSSSSYNRRAVINRKDSKNSVHGDFFSQK